MIKNVDCEKSNASIQTNYALPTDKCPICGKKLKHSFQNKWPGFCDSYYECIDHGTQFYMMDNGVLFQRIGVLSWSISDDYRYK